MATGSKPARITPADGDAFLTSAITMIQPGWRIAVEKLRAGGRVLTRRSSSISGTARFAAWISRSFVSTMRSRMVGIRRRSRGGQQGLCRYPRFRWVLSAGLLSEPEASAAAEQPVADASGSDRRENRSARRVVE